MPEFWLLNYELGGNVHTRWLTELTIYKETGLLDGMTVHGTVVTLSPCTPYSVSERESLPTKVRDEVGGEVLE